MIPCCTGQNVNLSYNASSGEPDEIQLQLPAQIDQSAFQNK